VQYLDINGNLQTLSADTYHVCTTSAPGYLKTITGWPSSEQNTSDSVMVTFTCGFASAALIPSIFKLAVMQMVSFFYENRIPIIGADGAITQAVDRLLMPLKQYSVV
jgi:hypothetical protein